MLTNSSARGTDAAIAEARGFGSADEMRGFYESRGVCNAAELRAKCASEAPELSGAAYDAELARLVREYLATR